MPFLGTRGAGSNRAFGYAGAAKPNQVTGLTATDFGTSRAYNNGRIDLSWTAPANNGATISGYFIERSTDGSSYSTLVANTASGATTYSDTSLTSAQIYYYRVSAINAAGTSDASTVSSATATTVPQAPTIGSASGTTGTVSVGFTAGATGGKAVSTFTATSTSGATGSSSGSVTVTETSDGSRTYTVTATNANGTSTASAASNSVTTALPYTLSTTFNSSGTFTMPAGKSKVAAYVIGGGGGGAAGNSWRRGSSGGGGAAFQDLSLSPGATVSVSVGGQNGSSSFGSYATANGGSNNYSTLSNGSTNVAGGVTAQGGAGGDVFAPRGGLSGGNLTLNATGLTTIQSGGGGGGGGSGAYGSRTNSGFFQNSNGQSGGSGGSAGGGAGGNGGANINPPANGNAASSGSSGTGGGGGGGGGQAGYYDQRNSSNVNGVGGTQGAGGSGRVVVYVK